MRVVGIRNVGHGRQPHGHMLLHKATHSRDDNPDTTLGNPPLIKLLDKFICLHTRTVPAQQACFELP
jgi:hypothetical protein